MAKYIKHIVSVTVLMLIVSVAKAQPKDTIIHDTTMGMHILGIQIIDGDTFPLVQLNKLIYQEYSDPEARARYLKLVRNVKRTLPYAKLAAFRLQMLEDNLSLLKTDKAKKRYIKQTQKAIKEEFMGELKKMTQSQGKLLIKLIHRETGKTSHDILQEYIGNVSTYFWQGMAAFYNADLNTTYDPVEDYQIEYIIKSLGLE